MTAMGEIPVKKRARVRSRRQGKAPAVRVKEYVTKERLSLDEAFGNQSAL